MRFIRKAAKGPWIVIPLKSSYIYLPLVKRSSRSVRWFFTFKRLVGMLDWFLPRGEYALLISSNPFMSVQAFQHKLGRGNLKLRTVFWSYAYFYQFFHQALNAMQGLQYFFRAR